MHILLISMRRSIGICISVNNRFFCIFHKSMIINLITDVVYIFDVGASHMARRENAICWLRTRRSCARWPAFALMMQYGGCIAFGI